MNLYFNIHDIFSVHAEGLTKDMNDFLSAELSFFKRDSIKNCDFHIIGRESIQIPAQAIKLLKDFYYCNGEVFLERNGRLLSSSINNWLKRSTVVYVEPGFPNWWLFYAVEKTMLMLVIKKGYSVLHASGTSFEGQASIVSALQAGGKTLHVLDCVITEGHSFLGDDMIFIKDDGTCLCYPRGVNFNGFHGIHYKRAKKAYFKRMEILDKTKFFLRRCLRRLYYLVLGQVPTDTMYRLPLQHVYPDCEIAISARRVELVLKFATNDRNIFETVWPRLRVAHFLQKNIVGELKNHVGPYISAISAFGDSYSIDTGCTINSLFDRQLKIINDFLSNTKVRFVVVPFEKY